MDIKELTVGIEEEYQVIDPDSGELTSYIAEFLERDAMLVKDSMVPEFLKSQLEVTSKVCKNIKEARAEVIRLSAGTRLLNHPRTKHQTMRRNLCIFRDFF